MTIKIDNEGGQIIVRLAGRLDTASAAEIAPDIQRLAEQADKHIVLDCTELAYISSSGLRLFLTLRKESAAKGGKLQVRNINADIRQVFMMTGFISLFEII
jgi:anti-sigma B factor antagonist